MDGLERADIHVTRRVVNNRWGGSLCWIIMGVELC